TPVRGAAPPSPSRAADAARVPPSPAARERGRKKRARNTCPSPAPAGEGGTQRGVKPRWEGEGHVALEHDPFRLTLVQTKKSVIPAKAGTQGPVTGVRAFDPGSPLARG